MSIRNNYPTVSPTLDLDFANTKRLDPRVTFTRSTTATYYNNAGLLATANINEPRFDVDPVTKESKGLLIEEARTNLLTYSEDASSWNTPSGVIPNTTIAPDGTLSADTIIDPATSASHNGANVSISEGVTYTLSRYFSKQSTCDWIRLRVSTSGGSISAFANIQTKTTGAILGSFGSSFTFTDLGDYLRVSITYTPAVGDGGLRSFIWCPVSTNNTTTVATNKSMIVWGAQVEQGAFSTSYIPTTSTPLPRGADNASMTGTAFSSWYNQSEGTIAVGYTLTTSTFNFSGNFAAVSFNDTTNNNAINVYYGGNHVQYQSLVSSVTQANITQAGTTPMITQACAYKTNDFATSINGGQVLTDTLGSLPIPTQARIGSIASGSVYLNGHIQSIKYYPARITNTQLQALTTI